MVFLQQRAPVVAGHPLFVEATPETLVTGIPGAKMPGVLSVPAAGQSVLVGVSCDRTLELFDPALVGKYPVSVAMLNREPTVALVG